MYFSLYECKVDAYLKSSNWVESSRNHSGHIHQSSFRHSRTLWTQKNPKCPVRTIERSPARGFRGSHPTLLPELWEEPIRLTVVKKDEILTPSQHTPFDFDVVFKVSHSEPIFYALAYMLSCVGENDFGIVGTLVGE